MRSLHGSRHHLPTNLDILPSVEGVVDLVLPHLVKLELC